MQLFLRPKKKKKYHYLLTHNDTLVTLKSQQQRWVISMNTLTQRLQVKENSEKINSMLSLILSALKTGDAEFKDLENVLSMTWDINAENLTTIGLENFDSLPGLSSIGERIREMRKLRELKQIQISDIVGVSAQAVSLWEKSEAVPSSDKIIPLSEILNCDPLWLLTGEER